MVAVLQLKQQRYGYSELFRSSGKKNGHSEKNSRLERLRYSLSTGIYLMPAGNTVCTITWSTAISPPIRRMERMLAPIGLSNAHIHQQLASPGLFGGMLAEPSLWLFSHMGKMPHLPQPSASSALSGLPHGVPLREDGEFP